MARHYRGPSKISDYPKRSGEKSSGWSGQYYGMIAAEEISDVAITGQGRIDGAGQDSWAQEHAKRAEQMAAGIKLRAGGSAIDSPRAWFSLTNAKTFMWREWTLSNSQMWNLVFNNCKKYRCRRSDDPGPG